MESNAVLDHIDQLDENVEALEELLLPLIEDSVNAATKKLPILDRAKLNTTVVYAVESLLFSYLKINGVDAKEHAVYQELRRVQTYFAKVKQAEESVLKPSMTLNKQAAARMIQHSLVGEKSGTGPTSNNIKTGNGQSDMTQREKELKERILAQRKRQLSGSVKNTPPQTPPSVEAESMLSSLAREIAAERAQEAEGSEEGEIDETSVTPVSKSRHQSSKQQLDPNPQSTSNKKRKQNQISPSKFSADQKAEKKSRKKSKKSLITND